MDSPQDIQDRIVREIEEAGDPFNQFDYLLQKASLLDEMPDERKRSDVLVKDCQSQVWMYLHDVNGRPVIEADSDTLMIRGTIQIMKEMFDGQPPRDVVACDVDFIQRTDLAYAFDSKRVAGQVAIVGRIKDFAQSLIGE
jgi:cysteine desulfuration protein SufE